MPIVAADYSRSCREIRPGIISPHTRTCPSYVTGGQYSFPEACAAARVWHRLDLSIYTPVWVQMLANHGLSLSPIPRTTNYEWQAWREDLGRVICRFWKTLFQIWSAALNNETQKYTLHFFLGSEIRNVSTRYALERVPHPLIQGPTQEECTLTRNMFTQSLRSGVLCPWTQAFVTATINTITDFRLGERIRIENKKCVTGPGCGMHNSINSYTQTHYTAK